MKMNNNEIIKLFKIKGISFNITMRKNIHTLLL